MNKKGFTIAEIIVSFSLVSVILASMVGSTIYYRDKVKQEQVVTQLLDFKNNITKIIYDDVVTSGNRKIVSVERCIGISNCINFIDKMNMPHTLRIVYNPVGETNGAYISYDNKLYMLPDSDLGTNEELVCDFMGGFNIEYYNDTTNGIDLYTVKTVFRHKELNQQHTILVTVTSS